MSCIAYDHDGILSPNILDKITVMDPHGCSVNSFFFHGYWWRPCTDSITYIAFNLWLYGYSWTFAKVNYGLTALNAHMQTYCLHTHTTGNSYCIDMTNLQFEIKLTIKVLPRETPSGVSIKDGWLDKTMTNNSITQHLIQARISKGAPRLPVGSGKPFFCSTCPLQRGW